MKKSIAMLLAMGVSATSLVQAQWPAQSQTTKPWTRWWWMGSAIDEKGLTNQLNALQNVGFGGVEVVPIYGAIGYEKQYIKYLSPQWMKMLDYTVQQAAARKMGVDISVGTGWPIGGPQVTSEDAATKLVIQNYTVEAGKSLQEKIVLNDAKQKGLPGVFLQVVMAYGTNGKAIEITDKVGPDGTLNWVADNTGTWQIVAAFVAKTRQMVKRAAFGGEGYTLDHFSKTSINNYFKTFDAAFGNSNHGVRNFFNDSYEVYNADWTPDFFKEFAVRRGYDLKPYLRELVSKDNADIIRRVKSDYRQTMSDLMLQHFTTDFTKWAHSKQSHSSNQAHGSPGNLLDLYAAVDMPECETFGSSAFAVKGLRRDSADVRNVDPDPIMLKFASSAAHISGKPLTSSETFTWLTEHFKTSWSQCKPELEQVFLSGVNHVFYHGTTYAPAEASYPGWLFYASVNFVPNNSLWPHLKGLNDYISRCQSVLQAGQPDNEILAYWPVFDAWNTSKGLDMPLGVHSIEAWLHPTPFYKNVTVLQKAGYSFDFVSDKMLGDLYNKTLKAKPNINKVILVSATDLMPVSTLQSIIHLAEQGYNIVLQALPKEVPGLSNLEEQRALLKQIIASIAFVKVSDNISEAKVGSGKIILSNDVQQGLAFTKLKRETLTDLGLKFIRRQVADGKYYYIVNHTANAIDTTITLETASASVTILNPQTGAAGIVKSLVKNNATQVRIQLQSGEAIILKTSNKPAIGKAWQYLQPSKQVLTLNNNWKVDFISGGPQLPASQQQATLQPYTNRNDTVTTAFSGIAAYSTSFTIAKKDAKDYLLELGKVSESAKVFINGKEVGILWSLPFKANIGAYLQQGNNTIRVEVANLMANRIRYMDSHKIEWRKYHEINFVNVAYKSFDAANWKVQTSGLTGPVTITALY